MMVFRGGVQGIKRGLLWLKCDFKDPGFGERICLTRPGENIMVRFTFLMGDASNRCQRGWQPGFQDRDIRNHEVHLCFLYHEAKRPDSLIDRLPAGAGRGKKP